MQLKHSCSCAQCNQNGGYLEKTLNATVGQKPHKVPLNHKKDCMTIPVFLVKTRNDLKARLTPLSANVNASYLIIKLDVSNFI